MLLSKFEVSARTQRGDSEDGAKDHIHYLESFTGYALMNGDVNVNLEST